MRKIEKFRFAIGLAIIVTLFSIFSSKNVSAGVKPCPNGDTTAKFDLGIHNCPNANEPVPECFKITPGACCEYRNCNEPL